MDDIFSDSDILDNIVLKQIVEELPKYKRAILGMRTMYTQQECAEIFGLTRAAISYTQKNVYEIIRRKFLAT